MKIKDFYLLPEQKQLEMALQFRALFKMYFVEMQNSHSVALAKIKKDMNLTSVTLWHIFKHDLEVQKMYDSVPKKDKRGLITRAVHR
jgi:hypothetical protein